MKENKSKKIISGQDALEIGKKKIKERFVKVEQDTKEPEIKQVEMVYWSQPFFTNQNTMMPAWKVDAGTYTLFLDPETGEQIQTHTSYIYARCVID
ncbi:hypothetical protein QFZ77_006916 [Paenibacillus sp. V4I3]|uniref:hypothetical protein n=1 Tax=Paenibacillus sp. V4I3 TaxID=3042305 RepID=UPI00277E114E|nr:hypothetical protein [Paenibacillus sp. V4I3]MDQ0878257.1 hypothetical protein [Paenibacillus sp. V4I3]